ncbi:type IV pilin [Halorubrum sp. CSM-61]|uniref:type IV pilin n=1 Tax=Halorubrum sp. CSM-61 TaxID=2485838 RepID=UPI001F1520DC|nr:type IV pilin N-terminal domain-containing protein [Halorubrum sp. CSM-61]
MSPVIGVILMVAITVILAAVIGTFVLGLGDSLGDNQPTAQINADVTEDDANGATLSLEHSGGDEIATESMRIVITGNNNSAQAENNSVFSSRFTVGDIESADFGGGSDAQEEIRIRVIHTPSDSILLDRTLEVQDLQMDSDETLNF